jgi:hypothetical protein
VLEIRKALEVFLYSEGKEGEKNHTEIIIHYVFKENHQGIE